MDKYKLDGHKLHYHVNRVNEWLEGKNIYPVYMEMSPTGACNHRCEFCGLDFMGYEATSLDARLLKKRLIELGSLGLKSVMYAGEGEPLLHKDLADIVLHTKQAGIDVAITTNAVLLNKIFAEVCLGSLEWIKVSINAGTAKTYKSIHKAKEGDFERVINNMKEARKIKEAGAHSCALGMQMILLPENIKEAPKLAEIARDIGMDYLVIKPYSQHPQSVTKKYEDVSYGEIDSLKKELKSYNTKTFSVILRSSAISKAERKSKGYNRCLALPFWSYIDAKGRVWGCSVFLGDDRFYYGNINENSFKEIWEGKLRSESMNFVRQKFDASNCRLNCRMDAVNDYLWSLKDPPPHANFI